MRLEVLHAVFLACSLLLLVGLGAWCIAPGQRAASHLVLAAFSGMGCVGIVLYWVHRTRRGAS